MIIIERDEKGRIVGKTRGCKIDGCENDHVAFGYCKAHYAKFRRPPSAFVKCKHCKEVRKKNSRGICNRCYMWLQRRGLLEKYFGEFITINLLKIVDKTVGWEQIERWYDIQDTYKYVSRSVWVRQGYNDRYFDSVKKIIKELKVSCTEYKLENKETTKMEKSYCIEVTKKRLKRYLFRRIKLGLK